MLGLVNQRAQVPDPALMRLAHKRFERLGQVLDTGGSSRRP